MMSPNRRRAWGAYVEVEGRAMVAGGHGGAGQGIVIEVDRLRRLGAGMLPSPIRPSWGQLASGQMDAQWVEVDAVVQAADGSAIFTHARERKWPIDRDDSRRRQCPAVDNLLDAGIRVPGCLSGRDRCPRPDT